jgi:hypothetical protein
MSFKKNHISLNDCHWKDFALINQEKGLKEARYQSMKWDELLGFDILAVEKELYSKDPYDEDYSSRAWMGLPFQTLQTPYSEIVAILNLFKEFDVKEIVDLGAGYGRVGLMVKLMCPGWNFVGYEMVEERVREAKRVYQLQGLDPLALQKKNIIKKDFSLPQADIYFIYDFSDPTDLKIILDQMTKDLFQKEYFLIAKGKAINSLIQVKYPELYAAHGRYWLENSDCVIYSSFTDVDVL